MERFLDNLSKFVATFFGLGYLPYIPGTLGSVTGAVIYYFLWQKKAVFYTVLFLVIVIGFAAAGRAAKALSKKDPRSIIIDEVAGILVAFVFVPFSILNLAIVFALFRVFDVAKPYPVRKLESLPGSAGIMLDDILAGIYANIVFQVVFKFALCKAV